MAAVLRQKIAHLQAQEQTPQVARQLIIERQMLALQEQQQRLLLQAQYLAAHPPAQAVVSTATNASVDGAAAAAAAAEPAEPEAPAVVDLPAEVTFFGFRYGMPVWVLGFEGQRMVNHWLKGRPATGILDKPAAPPMNPPYAPFYYGVIVCVAC